MRLKPCSKRRGLVLLLALGLIMSHGAHAQSFLDSVKGAIGGDQTEEGDGTYLNQMNADGPTRESCGGDGQTSLLNALVEQGLGFVAEEEIHTYIQNIVEKLLAASPYPDCQVTVLVTPHDAAQAVALADGGILVALGFLRNLKTEDEVAALLAHELSHVLRDDHSSDSFLESQDGFLKGLETMNASGGMLLGFVDPGLAQGVNAATSVGGAVYNISESMIAPAWTIEQEDIADLLGTDLLVAAGYNPRAMTSIMDIIESQEEDAAAVEAERDRLYKERLQGTLVEAVTNTDTNSLFSIAGAVANITSAAVSGTDKKTHRPAAERKANIKAYIKKFHRKHRRRKFAKEAWNARMSSGESGKMFSQYRLAASARRAVFVDGDIDVAVRSIESIRAFANHAYPKLAKSEVRLKQGNRDAAVANLEAAMERTDAPWQVFRSYADIQMANDDAAGASETVAIADRRFGEPLGIAPYAIKVNRSAGNDDKVEYYLARCEESGSRAHVQVCQVAAGEDPKSNNDSKSSGSSGLGGIFGILTPGGSSSSLTDSDTSQSSNEVEKNDDASDEKSDD